MTDFEPIENTMTIEQLRREVRKCWDMELALTHDLRELPEVPCVETMRMLSSAGMGHKWPDMWSIGKDIQRQHPWGTVPAKTEYECAVGLWSLMRHGIIASGIETRRAETGTGSVHESPVDEVQTPKSPLSTGDPS